MATEQTMRMRLETLTKEELINELILLQQPCSENTTSTSPISSSPTTSGRSNGVVPPAKRLRIGKDNEKRKGQQQLQQQGKGKKKKKSNPFSIQDYALRHVALRIAYIGTNYGGFASQRHTTETVEAKIFQALREARLIDTGSDDGEGGKEREPITSASELSQRCSYTRCGRTDKGVSAFGQVISLHIRSNLITNDFGIVSLPLIEEEEEGKIKRIGAGGQQPEGKDERKQLQGGKRRGGGKELNYPSILNSLLPDDIRVVGWAPVSLNFNSRFSCLYRTYKYYFFNSIGDGELNIERMRQGAKLFLGEHDFRNFCKIDAVNVFNFKRVVLSIDISPSSSFSSSSSASTSFDSSSSSSSSSTPQSQVGVYEITICGYAFLWHQIRCMMAILFMIGNGSESPEIITQLLDVTKNPRKPYYDLASEDPLVLYDCGFEGISWISDTENYRRVCEKFEQKFLESFMKSLVAFGMLEGMKNSWLPAYASLPEGEKEQEFIRWRDLAQKVSMVIPPSNSKKNKHASLMLRQKEETLEEKVMNLGDKKKKLYEAKIGKREAATAMDMDEGEDYDE